MKKTFLLSILMVLVLSACQMLIQSPDSSGQSAILETHIPLEEATPIGVTPTATNYPLGERFKIKNYYLNTPQNWFYTVVNEENMQGWVFTPNDPLLMAEQGFNGWAAIVWLVTPIPDGADVAEMQTQMITRVDQYGNDELQAVLLPAQETGLIELTDEVVTLVGAEVVPWGNVEALRLDGNILFGGDTNTQVDISVFLTWNADEFVAFYQFSDQILTHSLTPAFDASRGSIHMP